MGCGASDRGVLDHGHHLVSEELETNIPELFHIVNFLAQAVPQ